ncbi:MAG: MFS transporter [Calditrichaeota bacterium]|nr:MFS transporter [Calditrichota bacterium]
MIDRWFPEIRDRRVFSWALYDWANSAFATTIMAAVLPNYYSSVICRDLPPATASSLWAYTNTITMLIIAVMAPVLGAMADFYGAKKKFLTFFLLLGAAFTASLYFVGPGDWVWASLLYIVAGVGFSGANIFYDSLLPHVAPAHRIDQVSVFGYALGYLGGGLLLAVNLAMIQFPAVFGLTSPIQGVQWSFVSVAIWWVLFSYPLLKNVPEPYSPPRALAAVNPIRIGIQRTLKTLREIRKYRELFTFLIAFWLYNDGIGTIIKMAVIFGTEIGIGQGHLIGAILLVQFIGIPLSLLFGRLAHWLDTRTAILIGLAGYTLISIGGYFLYHAWQFWLLAIFVGFVQGGTQGLSRSLFGSMVPRRMSAEFFGFYDISQKFAGILGPFVFGVIAYLTGSSRWGVVALVFFFLSGAWLLTRVDVEAGQRLAAQEENL